MEITNEFKLSAFMAYYGSDYKNNLNFTYSISYNVLGFMINQIVFHNAQLILKPLEEITDGDAIEIAKICFLNNWDNYEVIREDSHIYVCGIDNEDIDNDFNNEDNLRMCDESESLCHITLPATKKYSSFYVYKGLKDEYNIMYSLYVYNAIQDYLRSKGYNISFRGVDLVEAGIAVLKGKE
jgi:hypothetical protein